MDFRDPPLRLLAAYSRHHYCNHSQISSFFLSFVTSYGFCLEFHAIKALDLRHNEHKTDKEWNDLALNQKSKINNLFIFTIYTALATLAAFAATNLADSSSTLV